MNNKELIEAIEPLCKCGVIMIDDPVNKDLSSWEAAGRPVVLYPMGRIGTLSLWGDQAHGGMFLLNGNKVVGRDNDFISYKTMKGSYVCLSEFYGESAAGIYKKLT